VPGDIEHAKLGRLLDVGRSLVGERDPDAVLMQVLRVARELTGAQYAALGILDDAGRGLARFLTVGIDEEQRRRIGPLPQGHGILGEVIRNPEPLRLAHLSDHPRSYGFPAEHPSMETFLGVPVKIGEEVFGNLYLTEKEGGAEFDAKDEHLLIVLADWAAVAVDNARAHARSRLNQENLERAQRGLEATASLNREVIGRADFDRVAELVVKRGRALADARTAVLLLADGEQMRVVAVAGEVAAGACGAAIPDGSIFLDVLRAGHGQLVRGEAAARFPDLNPAGAAGVLVPLRSRGQDLGTLAAFDRLSDESEFSDDDLVALGSFGGTAANAIAAARALEDERTRLSIAFAERERQRWARELHDETLQELGALNVMQESALMAADPDALRKALEGSNERVAQIIAGLQGLITELRPAALDQLGVQAAVEALAERLRERSGLQIELDIDLDYESGREPDRPAPELEAAMYRITQEAVTNAIKHAEATRVRVKIEEGEEGQITVTVEDDGRGLVDAGSGDGFGLVGMRERVALLGGTLEIDGAPDAGTRVTAVLPKEGVGA
jgi:signal transduction histidine kinase